MNPARQSGAASDREARRRRRPATRVGGGGRLAFRLRPHKPGAGRSLHSVRNVPRSGAEQTRAWDAYNRTWSLLPRVRAAGVRRPLRISQAARRPCRAMRRQFTAELDQLPQLVQEAGAVVSQLVADEVAWKLALWRRRSGRMTRSSPPRCGKAVDNFGCRTAGPPPASTGRSGDSTMLGPL